MSPSPALPPARQSRSQSGSGSPCTASCSGWPHPQGGPQAPSRCRSWSCFGRSAAKSTKESPLSASDLHLREMSGALWEFSGLSTPFCAFAVLCFPDFQRKPEDRTCASLPERDTPFCQQAHRVLEQLRDELMINLGRSQATLKPHLLIIHNNSRISKVWMRRPHDSTLAKPPVSLCSLVRGRLSDNPNPPPPHSPE